jgi:hypothetical protein
VKLERRVTDAWIPRETTTHQDHVIAHVVGATFLGYFTFAEALYILLDIGFIWTILLDGQMGLLPHPVAIKELGLDPETRQQIRADIDLLLNDNDFAGARLARMSPPPIAPDMNGPISDVSLFARDESRRLIVAGEEFSLTLETSMLTGEVLVMTLESEKTCGAGPTDPDKDPGLAGIVRSEHEYLHQRLREELGREPSEAELDDWLRQHTEGY